MAQFRNIFDIDLQRGRKEPFQLMQPVGEGDAKGIRVGARVTSNGADVDLGGQCVGKVIRADRSTVPLTGTISGNQAYVTLDQACCAIDGPIQVAVAWVSGTNITTLVIAYGTVVNTITGNTVQPSTPIPDLTQLLAEIDAMRQATAAAEAAASKAVRYDQAQSLTNEQMATARSNINAARGGIIDIFAVAFSESTHYVPGAYATYNGSLYRFVADHPAGAWNSAHVVAVTVGNEINNTTVKANMAQDLSGTNKAQARANIDAAAIGIISVAFNASTRYSAGEYCTYNGSLYRFTADHTGAWNSAHVVAVTVGNEINTTTVKTNLSQNLTGDQKGRARNNIDAAAIGTLAVAFNTTTEYSAGQYCTYYGSLYRFITTHTGAWKDEDAVPVTVGNEINTTTVKTNYSQNLTNDQKTRARNNIGAASAGDVGDLEDAVDEIEDALIREETRTTVVTADSGVTWESGYFYQSVSGVITKSVYDATSCAVYGNVNKGDIFQVTARSVGSAYALYLADGNGNILDYFVSPSGNNYYGNAEYTVPSDGVLYLNTVTVGYLSGDKLYKLDSISRDYYPIADLKNEIDETAGTANANTERLDDLEESLPTKQIFVDVMPGLVFVNGAYVSTDGTITSYATIKYAVYGAVRTGDIFKFSGRKVGSAYCILLVTSDTPVNNKFTVLDVVTTGYNETGYITDAIYTVPQNGYLIYQSREALTGLALKKSKTVVNVSSSSLAGIKWTTLGDSLNEFNSTAKNNWIKYMIAETGVINTNLASSGTGFYRGKAIEEYPTASNYIAKISQIPSDTQLITIAGSFNDLMSSPWEVLPVGTVTDTGTDTIAGYMNDFFDALLSAFPLVPIGVYMTAPWSNYHYGVERSDSYVSVLKEICLKKGIPFFDNAYYGNTLKPWNEANRIEYYTHDNGTVDGVHPNDKGHVFIYQMLKPFVESISPKNPISELTQGQAQ